MKFKYETFKKPQLIHGNISTLEIEICKELKILLYWTKSNVDCISNGTHEYFISYNLSRTNAPPNTAVG